MRLISIETMNLGTIDLNLESIAFISGTRPSSPDSRSFVLKLVTGDDLVLSGSRNEFVKLHNLQSDSKEQAC